MIRPFLTPRWIVAHLALLIAVAAFVFFGRWQLTTYEDAVAEPRGDRAVSLNAVTRSGARLPDAAVGQRVTVDGRYDQAKQLLVPSREFRGREGFFVVTPLRTAHGVVAINRGWVRSQQDSALGLIEAAVTVTGVLQSSETEQEAKVDLLSPLPPGQIAYVATVELQEALPYSAQELYDGYVLLSEQVPALGLMPERLPPQQENNNSGRWRNLAYALQWWLFAAAAVFFWASTVRRTARDRRTPVEAS